MRPLLAPLARLAFVDSSAFFALANLGDTNQIVAKAIQARLVAERWQLVTTNFVVAETHALVLARRNRGDAARVLAGIDRSPTTVVRANEDDERRAREIIHRYTDKDFSLTDAMSFAVLERLRIGHAFTFDRHFAQYGFAALGPAAGA